MKSEKKEKMKVIHQRNLVSRIPLNALLIFYLLFDKWQTPEWIQSVIYTIWTLVTIAVLISWHTTESIDIFDN